MNENIQEMSLHSFYEHGERSAQGESQATNITLSIISVNLGLALRPK
jgi:hypothetical protein